MFHYPHIDPVAFAAGPLQVRWYGLMYLIAFLTGALGIAIRAKRPSSPLASIKILDLVSFCAFGVVIGGRVGYLLFYDLSNFVREPWVLFAVWRGGMSFHGGLLGVIVAIWIFSRRIGEPFFVVTDFIVPWAAPGMGIVRVGNFINGELWGKQTDPDAFWAVWVDGVPRHATQLYQAFLEGVVLFMILWMFSRKPRPSMALSGLFLFLYGTFRIAVELLRLPDEQLGYIAFGWLTMGQVLSAPMVVAGVVFLLLAYRRSG